MKGHRLPDRRQPCGFAARIAAARAASWFSASCGPTPAPEKPSTESAVIRPFTSRKARQNCRSMPAIGRRPRSSTRT